MPLAFLPDREVLFLWVDDTAQRHLSPLVAHGKPLRAELVLPNGQRPVDGLQLPLLDAVEQLAVVPAASLDTLPGSVATWVLAGKLALELVARERVVPTLARRNGHIEARWAAALSASSEHDSCSIGAMGGALAHCAPRARAELRSPRFYRTHGRRLPRALEQPHNASRRIPTPITGAVLPSDPSCT